MVPGHVSSLTNYFAVPKGLDDFRNVYDATKCGLNAAVSAPNFYMPTIDACLRSVEASTYSGDNDLGDMFLNYILHEAIRSYVGIDVTDCLLSPKENYYEPRDEYHGRAKIWYRWNRCMMGFSQSPYNAIKACHHSEEIMRGDNRDQQSPFFWDCVVLNLPGNSNYDPAYPWVYKWRSDWKCIAGDIIIFVDDIRPTGKNYDHCERVMHTTASKSNYLGQQDAPRKRRMPSQSPGLWSGSLVKTDNKNVFVSTSQSKWNKGRSIVFGLIKEYEDINVGDEEFHPTLDFKALERSRGFLVHLAGTYPFIKPRLKGIHNTLENWRLDRDEDGWKLDQLNLTTTISEGRRNDSECSPSSFGHSDRYNGERVTAVKRLKFDLLALGNFFKTIEAPLRLVRGKRILVVRYGFGDASGSGFGSSWIDKNGSTSYRYGVWGTDMQSQSSNYRELCNLVETLEHFGSTNDLEGIELFIFTDNSVAEAAYYKGNSSSKLLFDLILRLTILEVNFKMKLHIIHVSGTRMIDQGSDGLSRGNLLEGVMKGEKMLSFIPLHKSALDEQDNLECWIRSWIPNGKEAHVLKPEDWFVKGHDIAGYTTNLDGITIPVIKDGTYIWSPPPAAADVAIQELRKARHKRQDSYHVFVCPRLMKPLWFKQAYKAGDMVFDLKAGHPHWSSDRHEPLIVVLCFPYLSHNPWLLRNTPPIHAVDRLLRKMWQDAEESGVSALRELCLFTRSLDTLSSGMVWQMLHSGYKNKLSCLSGRE